MKQYVNESGFLRIENDDLPPPYSPPNKNPPFMQSLAMLHSVEDIQQLSANGISDYQPTSVINGLLNQIKPGFVGTQDTGNLSGDLLENYPKPQELQGLLNLFSQFQIPIGMLELVLKAKNYDANFTIDDSGSTHAFTDSLLRVAHPALLEGRKPSFNEKMRRIEEIEHRLHLMADLLAYVPNIQLWYSFMGQYVYPKVNQNFSLQKQNDETPEAYRTRVHVEIREHFKNIKFINCTPTYESMSASFEAANLTGKKTMHHLLTDGVPNSPSGQYGKQQVVNLFNSRNSPDKNPIFLSSCTDKDEEAEWLKFAEEHVAYCSEADDYNDEAREIAIDQGPAFPYSFGMWLMCQTFGALSKDLLDALDESLPFTKASMEKLMGRELSKQEYRYYFDLNPHAKLYRDHYHAFENDKGKTASQIIPAATRRERERLAGYRDGKPQIGDEYRALYAYLPLSLHTFSALYDKVTPTCCGIFSKPYAEGSEYRDYFNSLPFIQNLSDKDKSYLYNQLSQETMRHAQELVDLSKISQIIEPREVTHAAEAHQGQIYIQLPSNM